MPVNILIADSHFVLRFGLITLISEIIPLVRIYEAKSFGDIIERLQEQSIDLIINDIKMPGMENLEFIQKWRAVRPQVKILVFTEYSEERNVLRFIKCGVNGFLSKRSNQSEIKEAILTVINEGMFISKTARDMIIKTALSPPKETTENPFEQLSGREKAVLQLMLKGYGTKEIANELTLHINTVSTYKRRIYTKIAVTNLPDLIDKFKSYETY